MRIVAWLSIWLACLAVSLWSLAAIPLSAVFGSGARGWRLAVGFDQLGNVAAGGDEDEVFSSRCWRMRDKAIYGRLVKFIDWLFFVLDGQANHCLNAWIEEQKKCQIRRTKGANNTNTQRKRRAKK